MSSTTTMAATTVVEPVLIGIDEVAARCSLSEDDVRRLVRRGLFPAPDFPFSKRRWRWRAETIRRFVTGEVTVTTAR